jgi:hypothetical protein
LPWFHPLPRAPLLMQLVSRTVHTHKHTLYKLRQSCYFTIYYTLLELC